MIAGIYLLICRNNTHEFKQKTWFDLIQANDVMKIFFKPESEFQTSAYVI